MEKVRRWLTEVNGSLGGEKVIFIGIISEWKSDLESGQIRTFNMTAMYKKITGNSLPVSLQGMKIEDNRPLNNLEVAKREFKSVVKRLGVLEERISWKEEFR